MRQILFVLLSAIAACGPKADYEVREAVLEDYIDAVNRNDVIEALAVHTPDAEFLIPGQNLIRGTEAMRSLLQWDSVLGSHIRFAPLEWHGDTLVVGAGAERNAWFSGIGIDSIQYEAGTRFVFDGNRIRGVYPSRLQPESLAEFVAKFSEFSVWADATAPEVARLAPDGLFRYDAAAAESWLAVLERYRTEGQR
jgi:hypothetical protein